MTVEVRFVDEAVAELEDAALWYEERREGLGLASLAAVDRAVESVVRWPRVGALVEDVPEDLEARRVPVPRLPTSSPTSSQTTPTTKIGDSGR